MAGIGLSILRYIPQVLAGVGLSSLFNLASDDNESSQVNEIIEANQSNRFIMYALFAVVGFLIYKVFKK